MGFKIVFVCLLDQGHLQIPVAIAKSLLARDATFEIYFVCNEKIDELIKSKCSKFKTLVYEEPETTKRDLEKKRKESLAIWMMENRERFEKNASSVSYMIGDWKRKQEQIKNLINQVNPDLVIVEHLFNLPFIMAMDYKWGLIVSTNPLKIADQINYPPMGSGVDKDFKWYCDIYRECGAPFRKALDDWYKECGLVRKPSLSHIEPSPYFNVFLYPKMLNYFEPDDPMLGGKWIQLSSTILKDETAAFIRDQGWVTEQAPSSEQLLTEEFLSKPGKLILFSLGTLVSESLEIFERILPVFAQCPHKFIVSKGKKGDQFELPPNCVGANHINQLELLPKCDLFITHGGNNSFTEACYFSVPVIIIPAMGDQHDNACRVETFGLGKKVLLQNISSELSSAIEYVCANETIKKKMKEISESIRKDDATDRLCDLVIETCSK